MTDPLTAALLIIGNEILSGRTQDTNTSWIASKLAHRGIRLVQVRVVHDVEEDIVEAVQALQKKAATVFTTGGIGPTHDDITSESVAKAFNVPLELNPEARQMLLDYYESEDKLTEARLKMAMIPQGARLIPNQVSGAPGFKIGNVYVMAGVPRIMQAMLDNILPELVEGPPILSNTVTCDLQESVIAADLSDIQNRFPTVDIGSYPHFRSGSLGLSLVLRSADQQSLTLATDDVVALVRKNGMEPRAISIQTKA